MISMKCVERPACPSYDDYKGCVQSNVSVCTRRSARYLGDRSRYSEANFA